jgi:hypothetical protein
LAKTRKILYREFTRSPAKTGFLLAMCPVALYFIIPAVLPGKSSKSKAKVNKRAMVVEDKLPHFVAPATPNNAAPAERPQWEQMLSWMEQDPYTRPMRWQHELRDPFHPCWVVADEELVAAETTESEPEPAKAPIVRKTPTDARFTLTATMVGPEIRLATINGRTYRELDTILTNERSDNEREPNQQFQLLKVGRRSVILGRSGERFELSIRKTRVRRGHALISHVRNKE